MELEKVIEICQTLKCKANVWIGSDGKIQGTANFYEVSKEKLRMHRIMEIFGVSKLEKQTYGFTDDIDLVGPGFRINRYDTCKIVGYKEEFVPAHVRKVPIYDCSQKV